MPAEDARRQLDLPLDKSFVLFAANPDNPIKRYTLAKEAVALLKSRFDVELVTVYRASHDLIPLYMNACDVLILTSAHEGSPTVIKEALACNLPVVSVDVGDVCYRIGNIPGCIVCADDSPERISEGLAEVLQVRERISSRESISDLDEREIVKQIIEVYRAAVNKGSVSLCRKGHNFT
jgi:glycosyltransferase involved in cell wall biosynthesis